ncbi:MULTISPECIES: bestrophin-like domain [Enterobacteriaceae]|uniref:DUF4239 domain-containing protein n=1 Tax=Yokenella regensburgei TaxID=158877 RepID=A0AB38G1A2_9ENTR|nr:hypothetical protein [Yokenella regensburgei]EHN8909278.1 hypothetical protein [Enterobacter hormaechei]KFD22986.1 hypothetical protein GYRE_02516 [Yokenella regensburgei ATCC 49455]SQA65310.1 Uncharacterised protein [Yokenella regensburgei]SQA95761.1 Uncharacterised protein [Yokenella regensburgei]SUQ03886.1 Uncharacterised protein [Yokenella regensburgei]
MLSYYFMLPAVDDVLLLSVILSLLIMSSYIDRYLRHYFHANVSTGNDIVITSGTLALSLLLIGFAFSVAINGFVMLKQSQVREAQAIEKAWLYTQLLPEPTQQKAQEQMRKYLDERIHFFRDSSLQGGRSWNRQSEMSQQQLWGLVVAEAQHNPTPVMVQLLSSWSELRTAQQQTTALHQRNIPDAAWLVILLLAMMTCCMAGRQHADRRHGLYLLVLPVMISLSLFLVAEIDIPGEGIIRVMPDDLEHVLFTLPPLSTGTQHDPTHSVYHIH